MFRRTKDEVAPVPPAVGRGPFTDAEEAAATALWRLTALPREEFDATYGDLLRRSWRAVAGPRGADWTALRERALKCAVAALKVRQAHVLPRFAAAEDTARLGEAMSFALAACVPRSFGALLLPRLVGAAGHEWLAEQPEALRAAAAYFGGGPSELRAIADDAAARIGMPVVAPPAEHTPAEATSRPEEQAAGTQGGPQRGETPATGATPASARTEGPARPAAPEPDRAPSDIGDERLGWRWVNRVRAGLREGGIRANAEGGWLHNIDGAAYVVDPDCFEALAAAESTTPKSIRNRVLRLGRHRTRRSAGGRADAFPAELADGRRVSGMLFPGKLFWDEDAPPASKSVLR